MWKVDDLTGRRFGRLTVTGRAEDYVARKSGCTHTQWICDCDCGTVGIVVIGHNLRSGRTQSCGCLRKETMRRRRR